MREQSFVILVYNEEDFISRCLESIKNYAKEIVIGNNECTDDTISIIEKFCNENNIPYKIKDITLKELYDNGFAWAKNQLIEMCEGNLIHVIDGDERLVMTEDFSFDLNYYSIITKTFKNNGDGNINSSQFLTENHVRLFKKDSGIRYKGIIHEVLFDDKSWILHTNLTEIKHIHYTEFKKKNKGRILNLYYALLYKAYCNEELREGISNYWFDVVVKNNLENIKKESENFINNLK